MPTKYNIVDVWKGADFLRVCRALDVNDVPLDLTGYTMRLVVRNGRGALIFSRDLAMEGGMSARAQGYATAAGFTTTRGCIELTMTREDTRLLDGDGLTTYEIEPRIGGFQEPPMFYGAMIAAGGGNDD